MPRTRSPSRSATGDGVAVYTGLSQPWSVRPEPTSGLNVHVLDFSGLTVQGAGFRIESADQCSHPFVVTSRVYDRLRADALRFFYVMRSGTPILDKRCARLWPTRRPCRAASESW